MVDFIQKVVIVTASLGWMVVSTGLILLNKYLLKDLGFHFPMALTCLGMICSFFASFVACHVFKLVESKRQVSGRMFVMQLLPVGFFMAVSMQLGNFAYLELTVAFIQMLKALCPVFTLVALAAARLLTPSGPLVSSVLLISIGVMVSSYGEVNFSWLGMLSMIGSEIAEAMRLVMTQILLVGLKFHPIEGLLYLAPACAFWLITGSCLFELSIIRAEGSLSLVLENRWLFIAAGFMGFGVNLLSFWVIQLASSLTLKVLATAKNTLLVVIGAVFLAEVVTGIQCAGYAITMVGFVWYQIVFVPPAAGAEEKVADYTPVSAVPSAKEQKIILHSVFANGVSSAGRDRRSCKGSGGDLAV